MASGGSVAPLPLAVIESARLEDSTRRGDGIARHFDVHAPPRLPNLDPAECRSRGENLLGPSLGNAIVSALDYFHPRDMTVRIQYDPT
jgi:hypothetical protein